MLSFPTHLVCCNGNILVLSYYKSIGILTIRLVVDRKDFALSIRCMGSIRALEVHFLSGELDLGSNPVLRGPELLPWLGLLSVAGGSSGWDVHFVTIF